MYIKKIAKKATDKISLLLSLVILIILYSVLFNTIIGNKPKTIKIFELKIPASEENIISYNNINIYFFLIIVLNFALV